MKKIVILILAMVILGTGVGFAESWEKVSYSEHVEISLDTDSIKSTTIDGWDMFRSKAMIVYKTDNSKDIDIIFINKDTKGWMLGNEQRFTSDGKLISSVTYNPKGDWWNSYENVLWGPFVDKVIEIGNNKESK